MKRIIFLLCFVFNLQATVWDAQNVWDESFELKYQSWIKSETVNTKIFTNKKSPYYGLYLDCADLAYVLRAIFAYENSLPYKVKNPVATKDSIEQFFTNEKDKWDNLEPEFRLKKFLRFLAASLGSDTLSFFDSYPVKLKKISPGDIFLFKIEKEGDAAVRHTYIIKNINAHGLFDIIYSTQAAQEQKKSFYQRKNMQISAHLAPKKHRGFKRMKWPEFYEDRVDEFGNPILPIDHSDEQYKLASKLGGEKFFKTVQKGLQIRGETILEILSRKLQDICHTVEERKEVVLEAQAYLKKIDNRCMEYQEYDSFSTPSMDKTIALAYLDLLTSYQSLNADQLYLIGKTKTGQRLELMTSNLETLGPSLSLAENNWCDIKVQIGEEVVIITLKDFLNQLINTKNISFHPNDSLARRWGLDNSEATMCRTWYGQE